MTDPSTKAREIAEQIYQKLLEPKTSLNYSDPTDYIAAALREYGEEVVKNDSTMSLFIHKRLLKKADAEGYRRGIEEAAKILEQENYGSGIAERIRALLPSEGKE